MKNKKIIAGVIGIIIIGISLAWLRKSALRDDNISPKSTQSPIKTPPSENERGIKLEGMSYTEISEDGRNRWKIVAKEVEIFLGEKKSFLTGVYVEFYLSDGQTIRLEADKGTFMAGVKDIEVSGNVTVTLPEGLVFKTEKALYSNKTRELSTEGQLEFSSETLNGKIGRWRYSLEGNTGYGEGGVLIRWKTGISIRERDARIGARKASF